MLNNFRISFNNASQDFLKHGMSFQLRPSEQNSLLLRIHAVLFAFLSVYIPLDAAYGLSKHPATWVEAYLMVPLLVFTVLFANWFLGRSLSVDQSGATLRILFWKRRLTWWDIRDYGFSYSYADQAWLYFAARPLKSNGRGKKRFRGPCCGILVHIQNMQYYTEILDICARYTRVEPFLYTKERRRAAAMKNR